MEVVVGSTSAVRAWAAILAPNTEWKPWMLGAGGHLRIYRDSADWVSILHGIPLGKPWRGF